MSANRKSKQPKQRLRASDGRMVTLIAFWIESDLLDQFHAILEKELPTFESRSYKNRTPSRSEVHSRMHEETIRQMVQQAA